MICTRCAVALLLKENGSWRLGEPHGLSYVTKRAQHWQIWYLSMTLVAAAGNQCIQDHHRQQEPHSLAAVGKVWRHYKQQLLIRDSYIAYMNRSVQAVLVVSRILCRAAMQTRLVCL
jgi:hypothetical protein